MRPERATWEAMIKYADGADLTPEEWRNLSALTLIDRQHPVFEPCNCRWAQSDAERQDNERFYKAKRES